ncbi:hypothetical protein NM680_14245 [Paracoccus sp. PS-1]|nr:MULTISPECIES: hypothetical protein [unclassified Paracoccus (in: a-proteobacteria)]MDQ7262954.1 hypothetical protein [Paracoccus sp. PS1]
MSARVIDGKACAARLTGDIAEAAGALAGRTGTAPGPGGVGPRTIACLLLNTLRAAHRQLNLPDPVPGTGTAPLATETMP